MSENRRQQKGKGILSAESSHTKVRGPGKRIAFNNT